MTRNSTTIGNVKLTDIGSKIGIKYSDGDDEKYLLKLFKNGLSNDQRIKILNNNPTWAVRYHLSFDRQNLLNWYNFKPKTRVLEVGSGCGAITEELVKNDINVVANELSKRRATVNAYRNSKAKNLEIIIGNLQDYEPVEKFDYVVCVGVLEYAGMFINSDNPYNDFIKHIKSFLKPEGIILIAIENKLGFKYFAGAKEDHTRRYFDGINNYPGPMNVRTYGRQELVNVLESNELYINRFFYPHPDYKLPKVVYSDDFEPGIHTILPKNLLPSPNFDQTRQDFFSEYSIVRSLENNRLYSNLANSFLVEARNYKALSTFSSTVFSTSANNRNDSYKIRTKAILDKNKLIITKESITKESIGHINGMEETYKTLDKLSKRNNNFNVSKPIFSDKKKGIIKFDYIPGKSAETLLLEAILEDDKEQATKIVKKFVSILHSVADKIDVLKTSKVFGAQLNAFSENRRCILEGVIDLNLDNFIIHEDTGDWWLIDYEWSLKEPIPIELIKYRSMLYFLSRHKNMISERSSRQVIIGNNMLALPQWLVKDKIIDLDKIHKAFEFENRFFQPWVLGYKYEYEEFTEYEILDPPKYFTDIVWDEMDKTSNLINSLNEEINNKNQEISLLVENIDKIRLSKTYRLANKLSNAKNNTIKFIKKSKTGGS